MATRLMKKERRRAVRVTEQIPVGLKDGDGFINAQTENISASGAYCLLDRFIAPMTKLDLRLELPNGMRNRIIRCSGVVVRVEPVVSDANHGRYHIAVFFSELSPKDRTAITQFVRKRSSRSSL